MNRFLAKSRKYILGIAFISVFTIDLVANIPAWILGNRIEIVSGHRLKLYDTRGTFWNGSALLVALDEKQLNASPLLYINWDLTLGFTKFIDVKFSVGNTDIAEVYLNKKGVNVDKVNLSFAISQVSQLFGPLKDLNVSGNIRLATDHMTINKKIEGIVKINLDNVSSGLSKVNPLGSYKLEINPGSGTIDVDSTPGSTLMLSGEGTFNGLTLSARVVEEKKEDMLQFITVMGVPSPDGSYKLKIF